MEPEAGLDDLCVGFTDISPQPLILTLSVVASLTPLSSLEQQLGGVKCRAPSTRYKSFPGRILGFLCDTDFKQPPLLQQATRYPIPGPSPVTPVCPGADTSTDAGSTRGQQWCSQEQPAVCERPRAPGLHSLLSPRRSFSFWLAELNFPYSN